MTSEKGREMKIIDGYKFYQDKVLKNVLKWRCVQKGWKSSIKTNLTGQDFIDEHNHEAPSNLGRQILSNAVKPAITTNFNVMSSQKARQEM